MRGKLALIIAIVLGIIAAYGIYSYMNRIREQHERGIREVEIAVAAERIRAGTEIRMDMLKPRRFPEVAVDTNHVLWEEAHLLLLRQVAGQNIEREQPVLRTHLREVRLEVGATLPPGHVAVTLRVDDVSGVAGTLRPGSHVDVIATLPMAPTERGMAGEVTTWRLLNNCRVMAIDSRTVQTMPTGTQYGRGQLPYSSVTLSVVPEEAVLLVYVQSQGRITLALRNETDPAEPNEPPEIGLQNVRDIGQRVNAERKKRLEESGGLLPAVP